MAQTFFNQTYPGHLKNDVYLRSYSMGRIAAGIRQGSTQIVEGPNRWPIDMKLVELGPPPVSMSMGKPNYLDSLPPSQYTPK